MKKTPLYRTSPADGAGAVDRGAGNGKAVVGRAAGNETAAVGRAAGNETAVVGRAAGNGKAARRGLLTVTAVLLCLLLLAGGCNSCAAMLSLNNGEEPLSVLESLGRDIFGEHEQTIDVLTPVLPTHSVYQPVTEKLAYSQLTTDPQREAYAAIEQSLFRFTSEGGGEYGFCQLARAYIPRLTSAEIYMVKEAVLHDHPEAFWVTNTYSLDYNFKDGNFIILYSSVCYDDALARMRALENAVSSYILELPRSMTAYDLEKYFHDRLVTECEYDVDVSSEDNNRYTDASSAYGALIEHNAVCGGYANAMKLLLDRVGVPSMLVHGTADGVGHVWLMVCLEDGWYHLDPTWNDPVAAEPSPMIHYEYFNLPDSLITLDHIISGGYDTLTEETIQNGEAGIASYNFELPVADSVACNFYYRNALTINTLNSTSQEKLSKALAEVVDSGGSTLYIRFSNDIDTESAQQWFSGDAGALMNAVRSVNGRSGSKTIVQYALSSYSDSESELLLHVYCVRLTYESASDEKQEAN